MAVIGIITCEILELEFAKLLSEDTDIRRVTILEDKNSARLIELLETNKATNLQRVPHPHAFTSEPSMPLEVVVRVLELGLHRTRKLLTTAIADAIHSLQSKVDALMLGYGMCGGSLANVHALVDAHVPLFQPMDHDHPVHDCIALCFGGGDRYYDEQRNTAGTYYLTPGWSQHWRSMLDARTGIASQPGLKRILTGYERALLVQTPAISSDELHSQGVKFTQITGMRLETQDGTMAPLVAAWSSAKAAISSTTISAAGGRTA